MSWEDAKTAIENSPKDSSVYVGCDSIRFKKNGKWFARYATVVILHKSSRNGAQLFHTTETLPDYGKKTESLMQRLTQEVTFAVEAVGEIKESLGDRHIEVHVDVNTDPKHASSIAANMATGYVLGVLGIKPVLKPDGFAATHAADHAVRHLH